MNVSDWTAIIKGVSKELKLQAARLLQVNTNKDNIKIEAFSLTVKGNFKFFNKAPVFLINIGSENLNI